MQPLETLMQAIEEGTATMADVEKYIADMKRESNAAEKRRAEDISRLVKVHAELANKQAIESRLRGRSRIGYALGSRK